MNTSCLKGSLHEKMKICQMKVRSPDLADCHFLVYREHLRPLFLQIRRPVLTHPGTGTFTSGDQYFHNRDHYFYIQDQYFHIRDQYFRKYWFRMWKYWSQDVKVLVPGCESTGPWMCRYWSPDVQKKWPEKFLTDPEKDLWKNKAISQVRRPNSFIWQIIFFC